MSTPTCVRVRPYRIIFAMRRSMLFRRGEYSVFGSIRLTVMFVEFERFRFSVEFALRYVWLATKFAASESPGSLRHVPLTWRSIFGTVYVASPRIEVRYGSTSRQYGFTGEPAALVIEFVEPRVPWPCSGRTARSAHESASLRPVLVPPCTVSPLRRRAFTPTSTPCQFSIWFA